MTEAIVLMQEFGIIVVCVLIGFRVLDNTPILRGATVDFYSRSAMIQDLPRELVHHIIRNLSTDLPALQAIALTCRYFLPVAREFLFAVVSWQALNQPCFQPYVQHVVELTAAQSTHPRRPSTVSFHEVLDHLRPDILPKLSSMIFLGFQFWDIAHMPSTYFSSIQAFTTITRLTLSGMSFLGLRHVQSFVCSLPHLEALYLHRITFAEPMRARQFSVPAIKHLDTERLPRLRRLVFSPDSTTSATSEIAEWLARGPSANTLTEFVVPYYTRAPQYVIGRFGPSVEHLAFPLRPFDKAVYEGQLRRYTTLRALTVFMDSYNISPGSWYLLASLVNSEILMTHVRTLTIDVRVEFQADLNGVVDWTALDRLNDLMDEDHLKALEEIEMIVQLKEELMWDPKEEMGALLGRVEERLYTATSEGKKIVTRYWRVKEFYDTIISSRTGVL